MSEPHLSVWTKEGHAAGEGLLVTGDMRAFIKADTGRAADAKAMNDSGRSQSTVCAALGVGRVRAVVREMMADGGLTPDAQRMLVRVVSGTLPTFDAVASWYGKTAEPELNDVESMSGEESLAVDSMKRGGLRSRSTARSLTASRELIQNRGY